VFHLRSSKTKRLSLNDRPAMTLLEVSVLKAGP
jgi:hypothetical protein